MAETTKTKTKASQAEKTKAAKEAKEAPGIEESFRLLDDLLERLEDEDTPLEESFSLYEEGLRLIKNVDSQIEKVEQKLRILSGEASEEGGEEDV